MVTLCILKKYVKWSLHIVQILFHPISHTRLSIRPGGSCHFCQWAQATQVRGLSHLGLWAQACQLKLLRTVGSGHFALLAQANQASRLGQLKSVG